uniref:RxLR effector protein n=1 Tax=Phytophthora agathidicida TaxID=1642459 RepID=A0A7G4WI38_9STRA|nr:PaRXLR49 [Phytophthora agathidicida]
MKVHYIALLVATVTASTTATSITAKFAVTISDVELLHTTKRFLRLHEDNEERAGCASTIIEKGKTLVASSNISPETIQGWLNKKKSIDNVFIRLKLTNVGDTLFENPRFLTWLNYADDFGATYGKETSTIATLAAHYSDDALTKMFVAAQKVESTEGIAARSEAAQMQRGLAGRKSPDDIFTSLKLEKMGDEVLANPLFNTWNTYLQIFRKKNPADKASIFKTLAAHYGDDTISKMIEAAKKVKTTAGVAKNLEATQLQQWWMNKYTPDDVLVLLKLDKAADKVLENPQLNTWTNYMNLFNREKP